MYAFRWSFIFTYSIYREAPKSCSLSYTPPLWKMDSTKLKEWEYFDNNGSRYRILADPRILISETEDKSMKNIQNAAQHVLLLTHVLVRSLFCLLQNEAELSCEKIQTITQWWRSMCWEHGAKLHLNGQIRFVSVGPCRLGTVPLTMVSD